MGLRHSKRSVDIATGTPQKNGPADSAAGVVKVKEVADGDQKTTEIIEEVAEKDLDQTPNGEVAPVTPETKIEETTEEDKTTEKKEETKDKSGEKKEEKPKKKKKRSFRSFSFLRREKNKAVNQESTNGNVAKDKDAAKTEGEVKEEAAPAPESKKEEVPEKKDEEKEGDAKEGEEAPLPVENKNDNAVTDEKESGNSEVLNEFSSESTIPIQDSPKDEVISPTPTAIDESNVEAIAVSETNVESVVVSEAVLISESYVEAVGVSKSNVEAGLVSESNVEAAAVSESSPEAVLPSEPPKGAVSEHSDDVLESESTSAEENSTIPEPVSGVVPVIETSTDNTAVQPEKVVEGDLASEAMTPSEEPPQETLSPTQSETQPVESTILDHTDVHSAYDSNLQESAAEASSAELTSEPAVAPETTATESPYQFHLEDASGSVIRESLEISSEMTHSESNTEPSYSSTLSSFPPTSVIVVDPPAESSAVDEAKLPSSEVENAQVSHDEEKSDLSTDEKPEEEKSQEKEAEPESQPEEKKIEQESEAITAKEDTEEPSADSIALSIEVDASANEVYSGNDPNLQEEVDKGNSSCGVKFQPEHEISFKSEEIASEKTEEIAKEE